MGEPKHTRLSRLQATDLSGRTPFCPEDQVIADYYDSGLGGSERDALERHLSDCRFCRARIGIIERLEQARSDRHIREDTLARAKQIASPAPSRRFRTAPVWVTAAILLLAIIFSVDRFMPGPHGFNAPLPPTPKVRTIDPDAFQPGILYPPEGALIEMDGPLFRWSGTPGSLHYDVRIVSGDGAMIWHEQTERTEWRLPPHLHLAAGEDYYFRVDAYLTEAKRVSSPHVLFRVKEQP